MDMKKYLYYFTSIFTLLTGIREWLLVIRIFLGLPADNDRIVTLRKKGTRFHVRGAMDIWSIKEAFIDEFYNKYGTPVGEGWSIVDIGAGIGEFTLYAVQGHPHNMVYAFEPFPTSYTMLQANLLLNQAAGVEIFKEAIGAESGTLTLDLTPGEPLKFSTETQGQSGHQLTVPALSLGDAFQKLKLQHIDLLKLDCEGAEYAILFNSPEVVLESISRIVMEYHDEVGGHNHHQLVEFLALKGFQVKTRVNDVHTDIGYLYAAR
jgi:FkbM family methyltransferase